MDKGEGSSNKMGISTNPFGVPFHTRTKSTPVVTTTKTKSEQSSPRSNSISPLDIDDSNKKNNHNEQDDSSSNSSLYITSEEFELPSVNHWISKNHNRSITSTTSNKNVSSTSHLLSIPPKFQLRIRQNPIKGFCAGTDDDIQARKNARIFPLDPPPICELIICSLNGQGVEKEKESEEQIKNKVEFDLKQKKNYLSIAEVYVHVRLANHEEDDQEENKGNLIGNTVESGFISCFENKNINSISISSSIQKKEEECFFIFSELSVKQFGKFKLQFDLIDRFDLNKFQKITSIIGNQFKSLKNKQDYGEQIESTKLFKSIVQRGLRLKLIKKSNSVVNQQQNDKRTRKHSITTFPNHQEELESEKDIKMRKGKRKLEESENEINFGSENSWFSECTNEKSPRFDLIKSHYYQKQSQNNNNSHSIGEPAIPIDREDSSLLPFYPIMSGKHRPSVSNTSNRPKISLVPSCSTISKVIPIKTKNDFKIESYRYNPPKPISQSIPPPPLPPLIENDRRTKFINRNRSTSSLLPFSIFSSSLSSLSSMERIERTGERVNGKVCQCKDFDQKSFDFFQSHGIRRKVFENNPHDDEVEDEEVNEKITLPPLQLQPQSTNSTSPSSSSSSTSIGKLLQRYRWEKDDQKSQNKEHDYEFDKFYPHHHHHHRRRGTR